jgi:hypothetical protein
MSLFPSQTQYLCFNIDLHAERNVCGPHIIFSVSGLLAKHKRKQ